MDANPPTEPRDGTQVDRQPRRPLALFFAALAVAWFFPSAIAVSFLKPEPRTGPGYFRNFLQTLVTLDWFGWLLLAPAFLFAGLAVYFCRTKGRDGGTRLASCGKNDYPSGRPKRSI